MVFRGGTSPLPPAPPADLDNRRPLVFTLRAGATLHRFYNAAYSPIHFDFGDGGRFNAPDATYGVLYAAQEAAGAFAETFLRSPGRTLLDPNLVNSRAHCLLETSAKLVFIDFDGPGLAPLGATAEVTHSGGPPYPNAQAWSLALHNHPLSVDGIAYGSRHDPYQRCFAIFDRAKDNVRELERNTDLDREYFWQLAEMYGLGRAPGS